MTTGFESSRGRPSRWTDEAHAELRRLWATDTSVAEIAARFGLQGPAISRVAARIGLPVRKRGRRAKPKQARPAPVAPIRNAKPAPKFGPRGGPQRRCLKCLRMFDSEWEGNRICRSCKSAVNDAASGLALGRMGGG